MKKLDMTMSNDTRQLSISNDGKYSDFDTSFLSKSTRTISVQEKQLKSLISNYMVQNQQSKEQSDNANLNSPMALVNEMETDSIQVIPQMDNERQNRKQKQNDHEWKMSTTKYHMLQV